MIAAVGTHTKYRHGDKNLIAPFQRLVVPNDEFGVLHTDSVEVRESTPLYVSITIDPIIQLIIDADGIRMIHLKNPNLHTTEPSYLSAYIPLLFIYGHAHLTQSYLPQFGVDDVISKIEELLQSDDWEYVEDIKPLTFNAQTHSCIVSQENYSNADISASDYRKLITRAYKDYVLKVDIHPNSRNVKIWFDYIKKSDYRKFVQKIVNVPNYQYLHVIA